MDILFEKNGGHEPRPIVLDRRTEGQKKVTTTKFVLLLFCLKKVSPVFLFLAGLVGGGEGWAAVRLPKLVGDRMVLQRETELKIWGWADPGEKVTVRFRGTPYYTEADGTGKWHVMLPPQQPGGPTYSWEMSISAEGSRIRRHLSNVWWRSFRRYRCRIII